MRVALSKSALAVAAASGLAVAGLGTAARPWPDGDAGAMQSDCPGHRHQRGVQR